MKQEVIVEMAPKYLEKKIEVYIGNGYVFHGVWYEVDLDANRISLSLSNPFDDNLKRNIMIDIGSIVAICFDEEMRNGEKNQ